MDSFFKNLQKEINTQEKTANDKKEQDLAVDEATRINIEKVRPLLEKYKSELEKMGMDVYLVMSITAVGFELRYAHGGHHGFEISQGSIKKRFWEKGKSYVSGADGPSFAKDVDMVDFEKFVQEIIREFVQYAPRHGGIRKKT